MFSTHAEERYVKHFGALDQVFEVGNHTFVLLDAPGLVEEDHQRVQSGLTFEHWAALHPGGPVHFVEHMDTSECTYSFGMHLDTYLIQRLVP